MSRAPSDQAVRDRLLSDLDTSFFLQAGAGAGKTRILVDRVVELVRRDHARLRNIVAITFTEKAAGELRARIRTALSKARGGPADAAERRRLDDALRQVDAAHIETIHAFASSLLKERPFDAGIDPGFEILDALGADLDFTDAWHGWLWREEDPRAQAAIERALRFDMPLDRLREAAQQLSRNRDLDPPRGSPPPPDPNATHAEWLQTAEQLRVDYEQLGSKQAAQPETLVGWLREMPLDDPDELSRLLLTPARTRKPTGRSEVLVALRARWDEFAAQRAAYARSLRAHILNDVLAVLGAFVRDDADRRRREGRLTFEDLLIEARNLLVNSAGARRFFRERYSHILIDEFQDTDPLQAEIVLLLAAEHDTNDWTNATPAPGRLLVVGDPQQAIYRFRRADIDTYTKVRSLFQQAAEANAEGTAEARLSVNFRSRPELIAWYNRTHARVLLADETWPTAQAQHQILEPHREEAGPAVVVVPSAKQDYANLDEAREEEADSVARIIRGMVDGRTDFALLGGRPPSFRDIAILVNNRTKLELYIDQLEAAGIPYHHDSGRGFFTRQEIRDLTSILTALDDPSDEVAVVASLKSPPWSASDQELFDYSRSGGGRGGHVEGRTRATTRIAPTGEGRDGPQRGQRARFTLRPEDVPDAYKGPLREALGKLRELRSALRDRSLPDFVGHVLRESRLLEAQFALPRGQLRAANLLMMVQRAGDFAEAGDDSLRPFVRWLSERSATDLPEAESATSEAADNVVRVLTMHQAKGLEFPIVILPKLASGSIDKSTFIVDREQNRIDFAIGPQADRWETEGFSRAAEREQAYRDAEQRRLLYVATTRAQDWLIVPIFHRRSSVGFHAYLEGAIPNWLAEDNADSIPEDDSTIVRRADTFDPVPVIPRAPVELDAAAITAEWQARRAEALANGALNLRALTPSAVGHDEVKRELEDPPPEREDEDGNAEPQVAASEARSLAMRRGNAIHEALALSVAEDLGETLRRAERVCERRDVPLEDVLADLERTLEHPLLQRARKSAHHVFEMPLVLHRSSNGNSEIIEGQADLVFEEPQGWVVVDFKSDREFDPELQRSYQQQVALYAEMLSAAGAHVREAWLLYTHSGEARAVGLPTPETSHSHD